MTIAFRLAMTLIRLVIVQALRHAAVTVCLWVFAMLALMLGLVGLLVAFWIWLARVFDPVSAALAIGGAGFASGLLLLLVIRLRRTAPLLPPIATAASPARPKKSMRRRSGCSIWCATTCSSKHIGVTRRCAAGRSGSAAKRRMASPGDGQHDLRHRCCV